MRVLVLGGDGMLGHQLLDTLSSGHDVAVTLRHHLDHYRHLGRFHAGNAYGDVDVRQPSRVLEVLADFRPDAVVNAVGIIKQRPEATRPLPSIEVNALFPHRLAAMAEGAGARIVHISTDCVFSGARGGYTEADVPDPVDLYGRTKLLGEVGDAPCLTLRTSLIGLELSSRWGLVEWALGSSGTIPGYRNVAYTGLTALELSRLIDLLLRRHPGLCGTWHVASAPISKHDLLVTLLAKAGRDQPAVRPDDSVRCDRSLRADAFCSVTGWEPPPWEAMLDELAAAVRARAVAAAC